MLRGDAYFHFIENLRPSSTADVPLSPTALIALERIHQEIAKAKCSGGLKITSITIIWNAMDLFDEKDLAALELELVRFAPRKVIHEKHMGGIAYEEQYGWELAIPWR